MLQPMTIDRQDDARVRQNPIQMVEVAFRIESYLLKIEIIY
jgi:hypothetical protein